MTISNEKIFTRNPLEGIPTVTPERLKVLEKEESDRRKNEKNAAEKLAQFKYTEINKYEIYDDRFNLYTIDFEKIMDADIREEVTDLLSMLKNPVFFDAINEEGEDGHERRRAIFEKLRIDDPESAVFYSKGRLKSNPTRNRLVYIMKLVEDLPENSQLKERFENLRFRISHTTNKKDVTPAYNKIPKLELYKIDEELNTLAEEVILDTVRRALKSQE